jgi:hypothetical protein
LRNGKQRFDPLGPKEFGAGTMTLQELEYYLPAPRKGERRTRYDSMVRAVKRVDDRQIEVAFPAQRGAISSAVVMQLDPLPGLTHRSMQGLMVDFRHLVSGKGTSPYVTDANGLEGEDPRLQALDPQVRRALAHLSLRGLSYGKRNSAQHAQRLRWVLTTMPATEIVDWCSAVRAGEAISSGAGNLLLNFGYLLRHDRPGAEESLRGNPRLAFELYRLYPEVQSQLLLDPLDGGEQRDLLQILSEHAAALMGRGEPAAGLPVARESLGTLVQRERMVDPADTLLPVDPFTGRSMTAAPVVPEAVVESIVRAAMEERFVAGVASDDGRDVLEFSAELRHLELPQVMRMLETLQDVLADLDRLEVVNIVPASAGFPGGIFHVNAQLLSPQEYDTLVVKMREFFLSLDPESAAARTRAFVGLMGARPTLPGNVNEVAGPTVGGEVERPRAIESVPAPEASAIAPEASSRPEDRATPIPTPAVGAPTEEEPATTATLAAGQVSEVETALKGLERMRSAADRSIAATVRRGADRGSSVYGENFLDELLDLRAKTAHVGTGFLSALDAALTQIASRPGIVLAEEVLGVVTALRTALTSNVRDS